MTRDWREINEKIKRCRSHQNLTDIIACLENLFKTECDGMVAFALGEEYEKMQLYEKAIHYYKLAEKLFPLEQFKNKARQALEKIKRLIRENYSKPQLEQIDETDLEIKLEEYDPKKTLFVVSCTKKKIWDDYKNAPDFLPARFAYKGREFIKFINWADRVKLEDKGFFWIILSGKYGFIEPWHPIANYDVQIGDPHVSISDDTLKNQTRQKRKWRNRDGKIVEISLDEFSTIVCINCSQEYLDKIKLVFPNCSIESISLR